jgi:hypothetical protein
MNHPTIEIFFSYALEDEALRDKLAKHLKLLERQGVIQAWYDRKITAGEEWKNEIDSHLESANIILLLISADFLASDYCYDIELKRALERHESNEARVIPIILRSVDWHRSPFGKLAALPKDGKAITSWQNEDEAFTDVVKGLRRVIDNLQGTIADSLPASEKPSMTSTPSQKTVGYSQTNRESSTGFQINVIGGTVNIASPNPQNSQPVKDKGNEDRLSLRENPSVNDSPASTPQFQEELDSNAYLQLSEALLSAFLDEESLSLMVKRSLGINLNKITQGASNYEVTIDKLIAWAEANGRLQDLMEGSLQRNPKNPKLKAFARVWGRN